MGEPIIISHILQAPIERVWTALTDVDQMNVWYFPQLKAFEPRVGFRTEFLLTNDGRDFTHQWVVSEVSAPNRISYLWTLKEWEGLSMVTFELETHGAYTLLKLFNAGGHTYKDDIPEFKRQSGIDGWTYLLCEALPDYLSKV